MPGKVEALGILLLLLPGFMCAYISQHLAVRRERTELDKVVEALIFSFLLYLATLPFFGYTLPVSWHAAADGSYQITPHDSHLLALLLASFALGILYAVTSTMTGFSLFFGVATSPSGQLDGPGILLTKESTIESVAFLNWMETDNSTESDPTE